MKEDTSTQSQPPETPAEESLAEVKPRLEAAKSRVAGFFTSFIRKKKSAPQKPAATQDGPARPDIGSVRAALFLDSKGKIVTAHPRCAGFFGRQPAELNGLNIKDLLKPGFDQEITNILAKGKESNELSFQVMALRKDGSEFATQFLFRFLQDFNFRWAVFVQGPADGNGGTVQPAREPKAIFPTTETATTETPDPASDEFPPTIPFGNTLQNLEAGDRKLSESNAKARAELNKEREAIKVSQKKEEIFQTQVQTLQGALEQAEARAQKSAPQSKDWEKRAANLKKCVEELTRRHAAEQNAAIKAAQRVKELEEQLKRAGDDQAARKKAIEGRDDTRHFLKAENRNLVEANTKAKADLDKERDAIKVSQKKEEELQSQVQQLQGAFEIAEAQARESATQSKEWENKAAELKKSVDELAQKHAAEQIAAEEAAQRIKELEEQLKHAGDHQAAVKRMIGGQDDTRHFLKTENRNLIEANAKARAELEKQREAIKVSQKKEEELQAQVQKLQSTFDQAGARARESATQSKDWEKEAADLKKYVEELTGKQNAAEKATQRVKELEEQLKRAGDDQSNGKKAIEGQGDTRYFLKAENRNLIEANAKAKADLDMEREAIKDFLKREEELQAQVQQLQCAFQIADAHAREGAEQSEDWEKKAAELKQSVDELAVKHAAEQSAAAQRVKELEEQLKRAGKNQTTGKNDLESQDATVQRLEAALKKEEELQAQVQKLQGDFEKAEAHAHECAAESDEWKEKATGLKKSVDVLTHKHAAEQNAAARAVQRVKELEERLKRGGDDKPTGKNDNGNHDAANERLEAALKKEEELHAQVQQLLSDFEKAEAHAYECAAESDDWKEKAAGLKKSVDVLTHKHAAEQHAAAKAAQRVKELEEQLKHAGGDQANGKNAAEGQNDTRHFLRTENRNLIEANAKAKADLDEEREAIKGFLKKEGELQAQVHKLQGAFQIAEAHARESAAQSKDWEKKAADFKKSVDELAGKYAAEQSAAAQRVKELEEQLKRAGNGKAAGKNDIGDHDGGSQRLEAALKKEEELQAQVQKLQGDFEKSEAHAHECAVQSDEWKEKAAGLKKSVDVLTHKHAAEQNAAAKATQRVKELEEQLKRAGDHPATGDKAVGDQDATRQRLEAENRNLTEAVAKAKADLDKEREAIKDSRKKEEELQAQVQKLQGALEQAEVRSRESATQSKDWDKKAADLKKSIDELTRKHATEQNAAVQAAQRVKELEEQLKRAGDDKAAGKKAVGDQDATRQRLEAENRNLTEANAKAKADLDKEREAIKVSRKKEEELQAQVQKLQGALEQAEARSGESATQSKDWDKKAADLKKSIDELTRKHATEQNAAVKAGQRVKELEEQLKRAGDDQAATRERLEAENRKLTEANAKARAELDKERDAIKDSRKKEEEFQSQVQKLQASFEKAEARARESAAQSRDWEKKAAELKKSVDELGENYTAVQSTAAKRVKDLEQQLKRTGDDLAASKAENRNFAESAEKLAAFEKKAAELEERARWSDFSLAKANSELQSQRTERERAEKSASSAAAQVEKLEAQLKRQVELERLSECKIEDLEKTIRGRDDDLARASSALRKEVEERQLAQKQTQLQIDMGHLLESKLSSVEDTKKALEVLLHEKNDRLRIAERSLAEANAVLEKESAERRRVETLLAEAREQLGKVSGEILAKASRMYTEGLYSDCHDLMKEFMGTLDEKVPIYGNAWNLHTQTLTKLGRFDEAKTAAQERIKSIEERLGKKHPSLMSPLNTLAAILDRIGYVYEAEQAMRRILNIAEKSLNGNDLEVGTYLNDLSASLSRRAGTNRPNAV